MSADELRTRRRARRDQAEPEPEGFGDAVAAGSVTLALMVSIACVGFAWERRKERFAHGVAVDMVERITAHGRDALIVPWSGTGVGPAASTAKDTFDTLRRLGGVVPADAGRCVLASKFSVCTGDRYACHVAGDTSTGPIVVAVGLCHGGAGPAWTFDSLDLTVPPSATDIGNRADVDPSRDGTIRFGAGAAPPDPVSPLMRRRSHGPIW